MILNVAALVLVLGITFLHSTFGFYSGLVNLFCSVTALAVAFGYFEALTDFASTQIDLPTSYIEPASLVVLFAVTLIVLRTLADRFLRGNVRVPQYIDWAFGAACGFVNAQICVGVLALGFLMLPWGGRVAMYQRYERAPEDRKDEAGRIEFVRQGLWLGSDSFAAGLFNLLSSGSLKSDTRFASVYPDFPEWVAWTGNTVQTESFTSPLRDKDGDGFKNGVKVEKWWEQPGKLSPDTTRYRPLVPTRANPKPPYEPRDFGPPPGRKLLGFRLALNRSAADRDKASANHRFRPTQIRLVGDVKMPDETLEPRQYVPQVLRGADPAIESNYRIVDIDNNFCLAAGSDVKFDLYFEVDERFQPRFVEYRRNARAVPPGKPEKAPPEETAAATPTAAGPGAPAGKSGGPDKASGASRFIDTVDRAHSGDREDLPFAMAANKIRALDCDLAGNLLVRGQFSGEKTELAVDKGSKDAVAKFQLPAGKRIFQLATKPRKAASIPGQAMNFAGSIANQYFALDDSGDRHMLAGYYAIIKKDGQDFIELFFTPDPEGSGFNGLLDFKTPGIRTALQDQPDAVLGLIFLVPPGKGIVAVNSQAGKIEFGETMKVGGK
jgi:hypothetical protein